MERRDGGEEDGRISEVRKGGNMEKCEKVKTKAEEE